MKRLNVIGGKIDKDSDMLLTSSGVTGFTTDDRTKTIVIWIAGTDGLRLVTEIKDVTSPTQIELVDKTLDGMSGAYVAWGTDDTDPIQYAIRVAMETGHPVYLPPGHFLITKTLSYNTVNVKHNIQEDTYQLMRHGLQMFGGGVQVTFLHNEIKDGGATIIIDGAENTAFSFQQTGFLKDFHITSTGQIRVFLEFVPTRHSILLPIVFFNLTFIYRYWYELESVPLTK